MFNQETVLQVSGVLLFAWHSWAQLGLTTDVSTALMKMRYLAAASDKICMNVSIFSVILPIRDAILISIKEARKQKTATNW